MLRSTLWIGMRESRPGGPWVWYDGSPLTWSNWGPDEPTGGGDDYNVLSWINAQWSDFDNSTHQRPYAICEVKSGMSYDLCR
jgi:hypothetical protein